MVYSEILFVMYHVLIEIGLDKKDYYEKEIINAFEYISFIINY